MKLYILPLLLLSAIQLSAQLDHNSTNKGKKVIEAVVLNNSKKAEKPESLEINSNDGFKGAYKIEEEKLKQQQAEEDFNNKGVLTKAQLHNLKTKEMYGKRTIEKVDSYQGNFLTLSKTVTISFRDFGAIDGDVIAIFLNGVPVVNKALLNQHYKSYQIDLKKGNNTIKIVALNQGSLGANTAQYKLRSATGVKIASKYWYLATGASAIFSVTRN